MDPNNFSDGWVSGVLAWLTIQGVNIALALVLLVVGWWLIKILRNWFLRYTERSDYIDPLVESFLASLLYYGMLAVLLIAVLSLVGVETTSLIAVLGAASLAVGLALQGSLTSLAAGVMIIVLRPIRIGDYIDVSGKAGTVKSITLFMTELATYDNIQIMMPNSEVWGSAITNYSIYPTRMLDVGVGIDYEDSIEDALQILREIADEETKVLSDPAPNAYVDEIGESSIDLNLRVWVAASDYWPMRRELMKEVKERIEGGGLSIPYPHRQIVPVKERPGGSAKSANTAKTASPTKAARPAKAAKSAS
ncbi:mechanosensitive ion channel [Acuticoccus sp. MNP-M23]|uniref:mechanosensitive ion channel family protein n=1 Tax=Acuticoccus sp. MNP-M23 TaxID=3072793 RepID=UPI0028156337|nr:mechanosensitive ion channel domain-containing protein [Acuticoccus sp. MNP-M23]WMS44776.1 mechanosensitive ion channel [Acuticoccus sp. MNP-M23]